ncbi:hydroxymethylglutaryl-CoA lyase [Amycolatopsis deserti]|uniref:hydroxymethylglutaryl-CoA lyase n=1 Tax=Amycolatopsis deserti TaxID=185696 RepID=UPI0017495BA5|nr:hydroxymethylglutaryl-CoA lyase [Amycolatopsis deserti]
MLGKVSVCDVGPRDGLQNERRVLEPSVRAELCDRLAAAGLRRVEAVSFVRDDRVPAMAGAEAVLRSIDRTSDVRWAALVLNARGYRRALDAGVDEIRYGLPVTDAFAERNQSTCVSAALDLALRLVESARRDGLRCTISLAVSFGCPFEGRVPPESVLAIAEKVLAAGPDELVLADSIGTGVPRQVRRLVGALASPGRVIGCHFHNTRNTGYANALAAVEAGATVLDASLGGLGGCPFAPGATGNIATEDLVYLLEGMGYDTGIDLDQLRMCSLWLAEQVGHELPGLVARAGDPCGIASPSGR